jgi:hypothetical protein
MLIFFTDKISKTKWRRIMNKLRLSLITAATVLTITVAGTLTFNHYKSMPVNEVKPLIVGKWFYNAGACDEKLPRNEFFDISIFETNPDKVVVNKIILDEGRITELNSEQVNFELEKIETIFAVCDKIERPIGAPTMFYYKHPLKEFFISYFPKSDLLIQTTNDDALLFQRFESVNLQALEVVDSM